MDLFLAFLLGAAIASAILIFYMSGLKSESATLRAQISQQKELAAQAQAHEVELRKEAEQLWQSRLDALTAQLSKASAELADKGRRTLQESNSQQISNIMTPVREQFEALRKSLEERKAADEVRGTKIRDTFDNALRLFAQQQENAVKAITEKTTQIGNDANALARALKGDSKAQGDWGEMILEKVLETSGLRKDEEYFLQENVKDDNGANLRPDAIVRFPEGRSVVIDSKVSLTAYAAAMQTVNPAEQDALLDQHVKSVEKHVNELADKDYSAVVSDAIGFVLMFVPNESGYIAAMRRKPDLSRQAYARKVIIVAPSSLLMALQLAYNLWQYDRRDKNLDKIVKQAAGLYDKVVNLTETYATLRKNLATLTATVEKGENQLSSGKGSVVKMTDKLREMGVTPKKLLPTDDC